MTDSLGDDLASNRFLPGGVALVGRHRQCQFTTRFVASRRSECDFGDNKIYHACGQQQFFFGGGEGRPRWRL